MFGSRCGGGTTCGPGERGRAGRNQHPPPAPQTPQKPGTYGLRRHVQDEDRLPKRTQVAVEMLSPVAFNKARRPEASDKSLFIESLQRERPPRLRRIPPRAEGCGAPRGWLRETSAVQITAAEPSVPKTHRARVVRELQEGDAELVLQPKELAAARGGIHAENKHCPFLPFALPKCQL